MDLSSTDRVPNRLITESSPYLKQHADNPVEWYPWGQEALSRAQAEDKPILLSIGYSACHWCHVMAHESFDNPEIAALHEPALHQCEGRSGRASRSRRHLSEIRAGVYRTQRRLAADDVSDAQSGTILWRNLFPAGAAPFPAGLSRCPARRHRSVSEPSRRGAQEHRAGQNRLA